MADSTHKDPHPYDSLVKHLFRSEAKEIIPLLLQGAEVLSDQNIEIDRSTLKVDLALKIQWIEQAILHFEAQSDEDKDIRRFGSIMTSDVP